jgi:tRNA (Thr-GGU) A37 N-methylase
MSTSLSEVFKVAVDKDRSEVILTLVKSLSKQAISNLLDWSHIWIFYVRDCTVHCSVAKLVKVIDNRIFLNYTEDLSILIDSKIVDIKPYHPLECMEA